MIQKREFAGPCGDATVVAVGDLIASIEVSLVGTLQSYRAAELQSRNTYCREGKIQKAGAVWLQKITSLGVKQDLVDLQKQCGLGGICIDLKVLVYRRIKIRDFKDLVAGFDHMILDPLVKAGVFIDDDSGNLQWFPVQPPDYTGAKGSDYIAMIFQPSTVPCRDSVTRHILEFGWPDPEFRNRKKQDRRQEIRRRLSHA